MDNLHLMKDEEYQRAKTIRFKLYENKIDVFESVLL